MMKSGTFQDAVVLLMAASIVGGFISGYTWVEAEPDLPNEAGQGKS